MKKIIQLSALIATTLLLFSCSSNSPEEVAKEFMYALNEENFEKAKELGTESTSEFIDFAINMKELGEDLTPDSLKNNREKEAFIENGLDIEVEKSEINGDKAIVWLKYKRDNNEVTDKIDLIKKDGKWKVAIKK